MATPTATTTYTSNIPEQLLPYEQTLLDQASAFTDIAKYPYQQYQGERVAQLSPLTQQAMDTASQMGVSGQTGAATDIASAAGLSALGTQYDPTQYQVGSFNTDAAKNFMSPYMQNVVDVQQQQARRQADIAAQQQQAQAAQRGAFGGSGDYLMRSQGNADLQRNLAGIQATGLQNAYQQAQQQFNTENALGLQAQQLGEQSRQFGAGLGMQGLQTGLQAANTLGTLGQQQFGQTAGTIGLQAQLGGLEQQQAQDVLNAQYQDFQNYQAYPFKQLGFMSDIIRGAPLTQASQSIYQAPPSAIQNIASLGLGAYGLNSLFGSSTGKAAGGSVKGYAGGGSVTSREFKEYAVDNVPSQMLPTVQRNAQGRGDMDTYQLAMEKMAQDAAIRRGIASAFTPQMADNVIRAAGGGILAFKDEGFVNANDDTQQQMTRQGLIGLEAEPTTFGGQDGVSDDVLANLGFTSSGLDPRVANYVAKNIQAISQYKPEVMTPEQENAYRAAALKRLQTEAGPNEAINLGKKFITETNAERLGALEQAKGLAALKASNAVLQGPDAMRGISAGSSAFADSYGQALQADRKEKHALAQAGIQLADAERKERLGFGKEADASLAAHKASLKEANKFNFDKITHQADASVKLASAMRNIKAPGGAGGEKLPQVDRDAASLAKQIVDIQTKNPNDPNLPVLQSKLESLKKIIALSKTTDVGPTKADLTTQGILATKSKEASEEARKITNNLLAKEAGSKDFDSKYRAEFEKNYKAAMKRHATSLGTSLENLMSETGGVPSVDVPTKAPPVPSGFVPMK